MTVRRIALLGQPVLLQPARLVADPSDDRVRSLISDMRETLADARGLGLAAPQVYADDRVIIVHAPGDDENVDRNAEPLVLINPRLEVLVNETVDAFEGCLSIPGLRGRVPRYVQVGVTALDPEGRPLEREARGLLARILQHEIDHLDGILYLDRVRRAAHLGFVSELPDLVEYLETLDTSICAPAAETSRRLREPLECRSGQPPVDAFEA